MLTKTHKSDTASMCFNPVSSLARLRKEAPAPSSGIDTRGTELERMIYIVFEPLLRLWR